MQILPDYSYPYSINDISGVVIPRYNWFYDVSLNDFVLRQIHMIEETTGLTVRVKINKTEFLVPDSWNIFVVDDETKLIDTVPVKQCGSLRALIMHPLRHDYHLSKISLIDLIPHESCVHVMIPRHTMMLTPVGKVNSKTDYEYCCLLSPHDIGRYLIGITINDVMN